MTPDVPTRGDDSTRMVIYRGEQPSRPDNPGHAQCSKVDEFGRPLAHLHWTVDDQETANAETVLELFRRAVDANGWGRS